MSASQAHPTLVTSTQQSRWLGEPTTEVTGFLTDVVPLIPAFDRFPFGTNPRLDMIVRRATALGEIAAPSGVVSKRYVLVQHTAVIAALENTLRAAGVEPLDLQCRLTLSESGARMGIRVELPDRFAFSAPDGQGRPPDIRALGPGLRQFAVLAAGSTPSRGSSQWR